MEFEKTIKYVEDNKAEYLRRELFKNKIHKAINDIISKIKNENYDTWEEVISDLKNLKKID